MSNNETFHPALPVGWFYPNSSTALQLYAELQRELQPGHLLYGCAVEVFAWREGATDDVLFRHTKAPVRFTVVHLSWSGRAEIDPRYPFVEFDGSFDAFIAREKNISSLAPSNEM